MYPKLSIITINFNNTIGLQNTFSSVFCQTFQDFEYIIIDGGSVDNSINVIKENQEKIQHWVSEKDTGIFNAMNKGIKKANGKYLLFLNSGDVLNGSTALEDFILHPNFDGDIVYGDYKFEDGEKIYPDVLTPLFFIKSSLPHQSTFFKKEVFDQMGFYDEHYKIVADRAFYIKCFLKNQYVFKHIKYPLSVFDLSGMSNDSNFKQKKVAEDEQVFNEYFGLFYQDYKHMLVLQSQLNYARQQSLKGIWSRIINKIKLVCRLQ